jgi:hypothetical protein
MISTQVVDEQLNDFLLAIRYFEHKILNSMYHPQNPRLVKTKTLRTKCFRKIFVDFHLIVGGAFYVKHFFVYLYRCWTSILRYNFYIIQFPHARWEMFCFSRGNIFIVTWFSLVHSFTLNCQWLSFAIKISITELWYLTECDNVLNTMSKWNWIKCKHFEMYLCWSFGYLRFWLNTLGATSLDFLFTFVIKEDFLRRRLRDVFR